MKRLSSQSEILPPRFAAALAFPLLLVFFCGSGRIFAQTAGTDTKNLSRTGFPSHWWAPIPEDQAQWWEILPQDTRPGEVILSKRHELGIFSNFAATPFVFHGKKYASVEGFWYMLAFPDGPDDPRRKNPAVQWKFSRDEVANMVAFEAKDAGGVAEQNMAVLGINWVTFEGKRLKYMSREKGEHYRLIVEVIREKVRQNPQVEKLLLSTGDLILKPDNFDSLRELPAWRYFDIYMEIRSSLRKEKRP